MFALRTELRKGEKEREERLELHAVIRARIGGGTVVVVVGIMDGCMIIPGVTGCMYTVGTDMYSEISSLKTSVPEGRGFLFFFPLPKVREVDKRQEERINAYTPFYRCLTAMKEKGKKKKGKPKTGEREGKKLKARERSCCICLSFSVLIAPRFLSAED